MQIKCPKCELKLTTTDVNINTLVAKCTSCNSVFSIEDQIDEYQNGNALKSEQQLPIPIPSSINREVKGEQLILRRRWLSSDRVSGLVVSMGLIFFMAVVLFFMKNMGLFDLLFTPLFLCAVLPIVGGVGLTYSSLASLLNTTTIGVDPFELSVKHGPLPWGRSIQVDSARIRQIYCTERWAGGEGPTVVNAMIEGEQVKLLSNLRSLEEALYIEQEIEAHLGIKNREVRGSVTN